ncbi:MAG: hypothetical protein IJF88_04180 [Oscillospiraceae bacterium]|nr:hypothetical protein [Oscillospiraceae bacterium]MBQ2633758.1 hypothetical protein [Oscillospiraceae bacterium]MBR3083693.1 hypothetical protein [Oscillospiraceae bacterium]MBR3860379.1 hypothetical protein [Oscillospiraceae bacterium]MBR6095612.1 hypothetical protein [Oscillospiraceae bacterium]
MEYLVMRLPEGLSLTDGAAALLLREGLWRWRRCWSGAALELYAGAHGSLLFARPKGCAVRLAPYVRPFLHK